MKIAELLSGLLPPRTEAEKLLRGYKKLLKKAEKSLASKSARSSASIKSLFGEAGDDFYFWFLAEGHAFIKGQALKSLMPAMPDERIQANFTGRSGRLALEQAYAFYRVTKDVLARNNVDLRDCASVLDFGCGWGRIIRFFLKDVEPSGLWGIDCYREMIELCKTQNLRCNFELIDTMPPTRFKAESFDLVYLYSVFSHLSEDAHMAWLKEFARILKPGGMVVATTRPRSFIEHCYELSRRDVIEEWQRGEAKSFPDPLKALEDYDSGKFVHAPTGGGGVLSTSFYGESCIPKEYVEKNWTAMFSEVGFIPETEHKSFDQEVISAKK